MNRNKSRSKSRNVLVVLGTRAQLIKMAPVILELQTQGVPFSFIWTGQHNITISDLLAEFGLPQPDEYWYQGSEPTSIFSLLQWFVTTLIRGLKSLPSHDCLISDETHVSAGVLLVHGDTVSTLLGALIGQLKGYQVAHVEAGLRSFNLLHPFPEELTRLLVFSLSDISFCPGGESCENMSSWESHIIDTNYNTLLDTVSLVSRYNLSASAREYILVSLHRYENIFKRQRLRWLVKQVLLLSKIMTVKIVLHPATKKQLQKYGYLSLLSQQPNVELLPRLSFTPFINLVNNAQFVVTDGGSNQEECYYLGKACLIMRKTTERSEGLGHNAYLSMYSDQRVRFFSSMYKKYNRPAIWDTMDRTATITSPSKIIVDTIRNIRS